MKRPKSLEELIEHGKLWSEETRTKDSSLKAISFGLPQIDNSLVHGGLALGALHEFCCEDTNTPLCLLSAITARAIKESPKKEAKYIIWIGKDCWPSPLFLRSLVNHEEFKYFLKHALFIDLHNDEKILWSIETALRCPAVLIVVAHLYKISFSISRRLSQAAKSTNALGLFVIDKKFSHAPSSALSRWQIVPSPSASPYPRFELSLLKQKGGFPNLAPLLIEFVEDGKGVSLSIPSDVVDSSHTTEVEESWEHAHLRTAKR
ncbi:MAG: hypothetical protein GYA55_04545 [SAR324 cluster bacterium]|uniref:Uncharacterized protein n=1 Tax=SAR324 cluster bacterium TaxID=2024889 RepID=A0A7X9FQG0_9DELT|nr:hypothetical protein [SAR324 cluster bacterium]